MAQHPGGLNERQASIIDYLRINGETKVAFLAWYFKVPHRVILRDIYRLSIFTDIYEDDTGATVGVLTGRVFDGQEKVSGSIWKIFDLDYDEETDTDDSPRACD